MQLEERNKDNHRLTAIKRWSSALFIAEGSMIVGEDAKLPCKFPFLFVCLCSAALELRDRECEEQRFAQTLNLVGMTAQINENDNRETAPT